jgi:hypothetical protein
MCPLQTTVLGQMAAVMDALQAVGAPSAFATPWRPSSDTLLRLALVAFRAGLETASGEAAAGPVDEAVFETLADAISPGPGTLPVPPRPPGTFPFLLVAQVITEEVFHMVWNNEQRRN